MARGIVLTNDVRRCIAEVYLDNPNYRAPKIREEVISRLPKVYPYADPGWPGLSIIQKELTKIRKRDNEKLPESKGLDRPWSIASMAKYPIPPEALPSVLQAWVYVREYLNISFTVRQAKWVVCLYAVIKDIPDLVSEALNYAQMELTASIMEPDAELNTQGVDLSLFELMTGEQLSIERGLQILGINRELFDSTVDSKTEDKLSIESFARAMRMRQEITPEGTRNLYDKSRIWNVINGYYLIISGAKSSQDRQERLGKVAEFIGRCSKNSIKVPEEQGGKP